MQEAVEELKQKIKELNSDDSSYKKVIKYIDDKFGAKDVIYSREYATTPDMNCPCCNKVLLTNYPRYCSDCGTLLRYKHDND